MGFFLLHCAEIVPKTFTQNIMEMAKMKSIQRLSIQSFSIRVVIILVCDNIKSLCAQLSHCVCVNWFDEKDEKG